MDHGRPIDVCPTCGVNPYSVCNGHGDYGPHINTCQKCIEGVPHDDHRILTKSNFDKKIEEYFSIAIKSYMETRGRND